MKQRLLAHALLLGFVAFIILAQAADALPLTQRGYAAHYRPGLMEQVARNRKLPIVACMVASPHHAVGVWLTVESARGRRVCRVTDVPHQKDRAAIVARKIIVELDHGSNRALCPVNEPPRKCPVRVEVR